MGLPLPNVAATCTTAAACCPLAAIFRHQHHFPSLSSNFIAFPLQFASAFAFAFDFDFAVVFCSAFVLFALKLCFLLDVFHLHSHNSISEIVFPRIFLNIFLSISNQWIYRWFVFAIVFQFFFRANQLRSTTIYTNIWHSFVQFSSYSQCFKGDGKI